MSNKKLTLGEINAKLMKISDQIEHNMNYLQKKYNFTLDYSFKPISLEELKSFIEQR